MAYRHGPGVPWLQVAVFVRPLDAGPSGLYITCMSAQECKDRQGDCCLVREHLPVALFKALGDPSRAAILASLAEAGRPLRVTEIGTCCPQDLSVVSRHLATLRDAGVVIADRTGREVHYRIDGPRLAEALRSLADALEECVPAGRPTAS